MEVTAKVVADVAFSPPLLRIDLGAAALGDQFESVLTVNSHSRELCDQLPQLISAPHNLELDGITLKAAARLLGHGIYSAEHTARFRLVSSEEASANGSFSQMTFSVLGDDWSQAVNLRRLKGIVCPAFVNVGLCSGTQTKTRRFVVSARDKTPFQITRLTSSEPFIRPNAISHKVALSHTIAFTIDPRQCTGRLCGELRLSTDRSDDSEKTILVQGVLDK
jgi:hypothetical protein